MALRRSGQTDAEWLRASFNARMYKDLLNESLFLDLDHSRQLIGNWITGRITGSPPSLASKRRRAYANN